jgi:hypothetical protein
MRLILTTTSDALIYQQDNEHPYTMYGVAAEQGVEFNDDLHTCVRAFRRDRTVCLSVNQGGKHQDFWVPVGTLVILDNGHGVPLPSAYTIEPTACRDGYWVRHNGQCVSPCREPFTTLGAASQYIRGRIAREQAKPACVYQHSLCFGTSVQTKTAAAKLAQMNLVATNIKTRTRCRSLAFQTPYPLGPITRGVLSQELQTESTLLNRQPYSFEKTPIWRRLTAGQVIIVLIVLALCCGPASLRYDWATALLGLCFTMLSAWVSGDILWLVESWRAHEGQVVQ